MQSVCRSCGQPIRWVKTVHKRTMPVDLEPTEDGNLVITDDIATALSGEKLGAARQAKTPLYISHFVTCRHASNWRNHK